ncbi:MAG: hypothetical protein GY719_23495 [bacterium]|nr:hypothetical protein [bacterium]
MTLDKTSHLGYLLPFAGAALVLLLLDAATANLMSGSELDLGTSLNLPTPGYARYLALYMLYGSLAAGLIAVGLVRLVSTGGLERRLADAWRAADDRKWIVYASVFALLIPAALRTFLLQGAPLTDDESAYRYMAQLVASGRVYGDSPALKLFFDNRFMVNDGKVFAHFFIGWPALLAPGVWLGIPGFMNSIYSALTVPALFAVLRRLAGSGWAKGGTLLYLSSPMLMVTAATETSHTSCVAALAWFTLLVLRSRDADAPWWVHSAAATVFCVAFFIRPSSALGVGLPLLAWWLLGLRGRAAMRHFAAFAVPAVVLAALFLTVNKLQTGSYFEVAYQRAYTYAVENDFRFSLWPKEVDGGAFNELVFGDPRRALAITGAALARLNVTFLGWPCSLLFGLFAGRGRLRATLLLSCLCYLALHFYTNNVGIDTFAPMHFFELAWPALLLSVCGLERITRALAGLAGPPEGWRVRWLPAALACALVITSLIAYVPVRFAAIGKVAGNVALPFEALREAGMGPSVIFVQKPFIQYCKSAPTRGWVFVRPNNDPELTNDVLWANHLSIEKNQLLMRRFPDREGFVMAWDRDCRVVFIPLANLAPGALPDAPVSGIEEVGT